MLQQDLDSIFFLPLSTQTHDELMLLQNYLEDIEYDDSTVHSWTPVWGTKYTSQRFYAHIFSNIDAHLHDYMSRIKFFVWLIFVDRLNTKSMLTRHINIQDDALVCYVTHVWKMILTVYFLIFDCSFAVQCWNSINFIWDTSCQC